VTIASVTGSVGSVVGLTASNLDTTISSRASQASVDTIDNLLDTEIQSISDRLPAALSANGNIKANVLELNSLTAPLISLAHTTNCNIFGVCDSGGSLTTIVASSLTPAITGSVDQLEDLTLKFEIDTATAELRGQACRIVSFVTGTQTFTVTAITHAPQAGDKFAIA
jgi:hypothetical protein